MDDLRPNLDLCKLIAVLAMVVDHVGALLLPDLLGLRWVGRLAFPLFACCLGYNFEHHTRSQPRYMGRLWLLGLLSQPVYMWVVDTVRLNIFVTLALGLSVCWWVGEHERRQAWAFLAVCLAFVAEQAAGGAPISYGAAGVGLVMASTWAARAGGWWLPALLLAFAANVVDASTYTAVGACLAAVGVLVFLASEFVKWTPGRWLRGRWFYAFYPGHLLALGGLR